MTDILALINNMRDSETRYVFGPEAADALEAQARRIAELEEELRLSKMCARYETDVAGQAIEEMEKGRARIAELEAALKQMLELADEEFLWDYPQVYTARAAYSGEKE